MVNVVAVKKKSAARTNAADARAFAVVLEDIRAQFGVFGEAIQGLRSDVDVRFQALGTEIRAVRTEMDSGFREVRERFEQVDARFAQVDARFAQVDARFAQIDARFERIDARFERIDARFERIDARFDEHDARFDQNDGRFARIDRELGLVKVAVLENARTLADHGRRLDEHGAILREVRSKLDAKVDRAEVVAIVDERLARALTASADLTAPTELALRRPVASLHVHPWRIPRRAEVASDMDRSSVRGPPTAPLPPPRETEEPRLFRAHGGRHTTCM